MKKLIGLFVGLALLFGVATSTQCNVDKIDDGTVMIYGSVETGDEVKIRQEMANTRDYLIILNSKGGAAFVGLSIANHVARLQQHNAKITTMVSGAAMSAAAVIWASGDVRYVHKNDIVMFHSAHMVDITGKKIPKENLTETDKFCIDQINQAMIDILAKSIGAGKAKKFIENETWLTGEQAFELGIATHLIE